MKPMPAAKIKWSKHSPTASLPLHVLCVCNCSAGTCACVQVCMLEFDTSHLTPSLSTLLWGARSLPEPGAQHFIYPDKPTSSRNPPVSTSLVPRLQVHTPRPCLGPWGPHSLMLVQQTCHGLTRLPSLKLLRFKLLMHGKF